MDMKKYTLYNICKVAVLAAVLTACQRTELAPKESHASAEGVRLTAFAEAPQGTRTAISSDTGADASVSWTVGDAAKVYYDGGSTTATVDGVSASGYDAANLSATFVTESALPSGVTALYAVYPSGAASSFTAGTSTLSVAIPSAQDGSFKGANYMVGKGTPAAASMQFRHLVSYLEVKVSSASVARIVIAGENGEGLVGTLPVTFDEDGIPQAGTASSTAPSITLTVSGAGNYYAALLPGLSLSKGLSMRFYDSDGNILNSYCHQNALTTVRGTIHYFTDASGIDGRSRYLYATVSGAGDKDGSSWANAMGNSELYAFLHEAKLKQNGVLTVLTDAQKDALSGTTVRLGAGTYSWSGAIELQHLCTTNDNTLSLVGGFPAAGGAVANPAVNVTTFSGNDDHSVLICYLRGGDAAKKLTLSLSGITFSHSRAATGGVGVLRMHGAGVTATISDCVFSDNFNSNAVAGLHIADGSAATVSNCRFTGNTAGQGAAANVDGANSTASFTDCVFSGNTATFTSGGAFKFSETSENAVVTFERCTFTGNQGNGGGAIYCNAPATASATFTGCTFGDESDASKKNVATTYGGGAVYLGARGAACSIAFNNCNFYGNTAKTGGGAIHVSNELNAGTDTCRTNLTLAGCRFKGNNVSKDTRTIPNGSGGAVDFRSSGTLTISDCTFYQNYTSENADADGYLFSGGALCISDGNTGSAKPAVVRISGTTFEGNHTATSVRETYHMNCGGAIAVIGGNNGTASRESYAKVYIDKCSFLDNYANQGGALFVGGAPGIGGTTFLNDCLFDGNYILYQYGTTINAYKGGTLCINNATFHNSYTTRASAKGKWRCWINFNATNFLLSNSTIIGQTQGSSGDIADDAASSFPSLVRFDSSDYNGTYWAAFENNLIVNTKATDASSTYYSLVNDSAARLARENDSPWSGFRPFMSNKITHVCQNVGGSSGKGFDTTKPSSKGASFTNAAYMSTLTGLTWNAGSPRTYRNCYWSYSACTANDGKASNTNVTNDVTNDYPEFGAWLKTAGIDGFSKDQRGTSRPSLIKAGSAE